MEVLNCYKLRTLRHKVLRRMYIIMAFAYICSFFSFNTDAMEFTYRGIIYEVNNGWNSSPYTCSTSRGCCDYSSEFTADGHIVIPEEVYDDNDVKFTVTAIGSYSFDGGARLKSITLPKTIKVIKDCAFYGCSSLESLSLPEGLTDIGPKAFMHCKNLTCIDLPQSLEMISCNSFMYCINLVSIDIPYSVISIGSEAFRGCSSLLSIKLPKGETCIADGLFADCTSLEMVRFEESLREISGWCIPPRTSAQLPVPGAFYRCMSLRNLNFPDSLERIGYYAFEGCTGVKRVVLPRNLKEMEDDAFDCPNLQEVIYPVSDPKALPQYVYRDDYGYPVSYGGYGFLDSTYNTATLKVGVGGLEKARQTAPWKFFKHIEEVEFSGVEEISSEMTNSASDCVYRMDGVRVGDSTDSLPSGLYIVRAGGKTSKVLVP